MSNDLASSKQPGDVMFWLIVSAIATMFAALIATVVFVAIHGPAPAVSQDKSSEQSPGWDAAESWAISRMTEVPGQPGSGYGSMP